MQIGIENQNIFGINTLLAGGYTVSAQCIANSFAYMSGGTEDVSVILLEPAYAGESCQSAG